MTRDPRSFNWAVDAGIEAMGTIAGIRFDRLFFDFDAIVEAYEVGKPRLQELFGPELSIGGPSWAGISYGHVNCLGSELIFPENSEVAHRPIYGSLQEGIRALEKEVDFTKAGLFPKYLVLWERLKKAYPALTIPFPNFKAEGPITTAWLLRGHDFFTDLYDDPERTGQFLERVTDSVIRFYRCIARLNGWPELSPEGAYVPDDVAAMIPPSLWPERVIPHLETFYSELTTGHRGAHIEDLTRDHLKFLDVLELDNYDPSVSRKLTPALIKTHCQVPYYWRLCESPYDNPMSAGEIEAWILEAAEGDASGVATIVWRNNCHAEAARMVRDFIAIARRVQKQIADGCPRDRLG
jgi:hypothetical protein